MREQPPVGQVIDGEAVIVEEHVETVQEVLSPDPPGEQGDTPRDG